MSSTRDSACQDTSRAEKNMLQYVSSRRLSAVPKGPNVTKESKSVRIVCLGLSDYLRRYAFPGLASADNCEFIGVAGRDPEKIRAVLGDQFSGEIYSGYESALSDPRVDAVYITLPNILHAEWVLRAIEAGKHVICEKPLTLQAADVDLIESAATNAGVVALEAIMYLHHPQWQYITQLLASKAIGQIRSVVANYTYLDTSYTGPRFNPHLGGGALAMVGSYPIDTAILAFGAAPTAVTAYSLPAHATGVDGTTSAILEFTAGHAIITVSTGAYDNQYVRLVGTEGLIEVPLPINAPAHSMTTVLVHRAGLSKPDRAEFGPADQFKLQFERFAAVIDGREKPVTTLSESRSYAQTLEAVARSANSSGQRVALPLETA